VSLIGGGLTSMLLSKAFSKLLATQQMVDADCVSRHP
jgi:hypothetical protein